MLSRDRDIRQQYLNQEVVAASREKLLFLTYDIAIRACRNGASAIESGEIERANSEIQTAEGSIRELQFALRRERAEEVAESLNRIYDFMHDELVQANVAKDPEKVRVVASMLEDLASTWEEALGKILEEGSLTRDEEKMLRSGVGISAGGLDVSF